MNSRGILNSTITLESMADFFTVEYLTRCDFLKSFIINHSNSLRIDSSSDVVTDAKILFYNAASDEKNKIIDLYKEATKSITKSLQNSNMVQQIENLLLSEADAQIKKNNLYIEIAYKEIAAADTNKKHIIIFQPNIYGIGVNIKELWNRCFNI